MAENFVLKGNICYSQDSRTLICVEQGYLVCADGESAGVYKELPQMYAGFPLTDYGDRLIVPGLTDLHLHAPQYSFRGLGMDLELLEWLNTRTFPEEAKYSDMEYAGKAYTIFAENMKHSATTRACIFATMHREATELLMDLMEETGLKTMVGKVNMDRNSPDILVEETAESLRETRQWLEDIKGRYRNTVPILTPRFIPTCSDTLMEELKKIQMEYDLPVQSHLSENKGEIDWVKELCPWSEFYGDAYDHFGMFGSGVKTIMAHCVWPPEKEIQRMRDNGVYVPIVPSPTPTCPPALRPSGPIWNRVSPQDLARMWPEARESPYSEPWLTPSRCRSCAGDWWMRHASPLRQRRHSTWEQRAAADSSERPEALRKVMN